MTPGVIRPEIVAERAFWIRQMVRDLSHEIEPGELYEICHSHLYDIEKVLDELLAWVRRFKQEPSS